MSNTKIHMAIGYIGLGAAAVYLGFQCRVENLGALLPFLFTFGLAFSCLSIFLHLGARRIQADIRPKQDGLDFRSGERLLPPVPVIPDRGSDAALLGHEMKNYVCSLKGNAKLLRMQSEGPEQQAIIDRIDRVVEKLENFSVDLRTQSDGLQSAAVRPARIEEIAKACVRTHFHEDEKWFHWNVQPELPSIPADANRLEQAFLNLYTNAVEAGALNIETRIRKAGDSLEISIEDDGRGCLPSDVPRIFEPFFSTKENSGSNRAVSGKARRGLGMFIVQSIVENHRGRIRVRSKSEAEGNGHGLIFFLEFPVLRLPARPSNGSSSWSHSPTLYAPLSPL